MLRFTRLWIAVVFLTGCGLTLDPRLDTDDVATRIDGGNEDAAESDAAENDALEEDGGPVDADENDAGGDDASEDANRVDADVVDADLDEGGAVDADSPDATVLDATIDGPIVECEVDGDCASLPRPICGDWACELGSCVRRCPDCMDGDGDGYGVGVPGACAGADCDDSDATVTDTAADACYSGDPSTRGVGACRAGRRICVAGAWGSCGGQVTPSGEACNDQDDDCDSRIDEDLGHVSCGLGECATTVAACDANTLALCPLPTVPVPEVCGNGLDDNCDGLVDESCGCIRVSSTTGSDTTSNYLVTPFATIQAAIDAAVANPALPRTVCVATGSSCNTNAVYTETVTMANGVSVIGRYNRSTFARCPGTSTGLTILKPQSPEGVLFPPSVTRPTTLGGFRVDRYTSSPSPLSTTTGVTIDGATEVTLIDLTIDDDASAMITSAVTLRDGAEALITRSTLGAGRGTLQAVAVHSVASRPTLRGNCAMLNTLGQCIANCDGGRPAIKGRLAGADGDSYGVYLERSPGAVIEQNAICAANADYGAGVRIQGDAERVIIRGNRIDAWGGDVIAAGVWLEDCEGAAPWIVSNHEIIGEGELGTTATYGVLAQGDCHPVIERNSLITAGSEGAVARTVGVRCGAVATGAASRCAILGNVISGSRSGNPPRSTGVLCDSGGCLRVERNTISGRGGVTSIGLELLDTGPYVDANEIGGGCGTEVTAVLASGASARIQNNFLRSHGPCLSGTSGTVSSSTALRVTASGRPVEVDVHSNSLDAPGGSSCVATGIALDTASGTMGAPSGLYRNNVVRVADCNQRDAVRELVADADPRGFEHNDLSSTPVPNSLYVDEVTSSLVTIDEVNALPDTRSGGNVSVDPGFAAYPDMHLGVASMCIGAGTPSSAPRADIDGEPRPASMPSIGADERGP